MQRQQQTPGLSPTASFFNPNQPSASGESDIHSNRSGRELAPGLSIGYFALTPDQIFRRIRGSKRTAAVTIIDGTVANPMLGATVANPHQWNQSQSAQRVAPNFLSLRLRPDASDKNISLMIKLKDICDFIDAHYATLAEQRQTEQEAAKGFSEDDDDMFMGPALLGKTGSEATQHVAEQSRLDREVIIHGGRTERTEGQPTFVALAYLMRKHHIGLAEAESRAQAYDTKLAKAGLYLTPNQRTQLQVWYRCDYQLFEHHGGIEVTKRAYHEYMSGVFVPKSAEPGSGSNPLPASG